VDGGVFFDLCSEEGPEQTTSKPSGFVANIAAPLIKKILNILQLQRKMHIKHSGQTDDFAVGSERFEWIALCNPNRVERR